MRLFTRRKLAAMSVITALLISIAIQLSLSLVQAAQVDHVVINEYLANPDSDWDGDGELSANGDEFIELYNPTDAEVDISGWQIDDVADRGSSSYTIPEGTVLGSKRFLTLYGSVTGVKLNNKGDEVRLLDAAGNLVDSASYTSSSPDESRARFPDGEDFWTVALVPTPNSPSGFEEPKPELYTGFLLVGKVVPMTSEDAVIEDGSVLVRDGLVEEVWDNDVGTPPNVDLSDVVTIETQGIIYPDLINIHSHVAYNILPLWDAPKLYTNRYAWTRAASYDTEVKFPYNILTKKKYRNVTVENLKVEVMKYSEVKALVGGTTGIQGSPGQMSAYSKILVRNVEHRNFGQDRVYQDVRDVSTLDEDYIVSNLLAQDKLDTFFVHLAEGTDQKSHDEFAKLKEKGLLIEQMVVIHGAALEQTDFAEMAAVGAKLVWSPLSNLLLYGKTADVRTAWDEGVIVSLAPDWGPSGSKNLLAELKLADQWNALNFDPPFTEYELVLMATVNPARTLKWDDKVGMIQRGFHADLLVIKNPGGDPYRALIEATDLDVLLVTVDGDPLYGRVDWMELLKPMDYEAVSCPGIVRGLDVTKEGIDRGNQTWAYITNVLERAMSFEDYIDEFPGLHAVPLTPLFTSCDPDFFAALDASENANLSFDLWSIYYATDVVDSDGDDIPDETDTDDDNDGLSDGVEEELGTNLLSPDTDGDRVSDNWDYFPLDSSKWEREPSLLPYAVGILVAVVGGIGYYRKKTGGP